MGGTMGGIVDYFFVDHYYGNKAIRFTALITLLVLGSCNFTFASASTITLAGLARLSIRCGFTSGILRSAEWAG